MSVMRVLRSSSALAAALSLSSACFPDFDALGECAGERCEPVDACANGALDDGESDVDCGGTSACARCAAGRACGAGPDCASFSCVEDACAEEERIAAADLIDDMEDGDEFAPAVADRGGTTWYVVTDLTPGAETLGGAPRPSVISDGRAASGFGIHFAGSGFTSWGAALMLDLRTWIDGAPRVFDATDYTGISFWARAERDGESVIVAFLSRDTDQNFDVCDPGPPSGGPVPGCNDYHHVRVAFGSDWARYSVRFEDSAQGGFGVPRVPVLDTTALYGVRFAVDANAEFDFWIDDVAFTSE